MSVVRRGASKEVRTAARRLFRFALGLLMAGGVPLLARQPKAEDGPAAQMSKAPVSAYSLQNPFADQLGAAAAGLKLYQQHCSPCHGSDGFGLGRAVNLHSPSIRHAPPGVLFWAIRNGRLRKGMPSWSRLPDQQIWQLVTYLKMFQ